MEKNRLYFSSSRIAFYSFSNEGKKVSGFDENFANAVDYVRDETMKKLLGDNKKSSLENNFFLNSRAK